MRDRQLTPRRSGYLILIACAVLLLMAYPFLWAGLPYVVHPDEPTNLAVVQDMVRRGSLDPQFHRYPGLLFVLNMPGQIALDLAGGLQGLSVQSVGNAFAPRPSELLFARLTTLALGVLTVIVTMRWAAELSRAVFATGLSAALLVASPLFPHQAVMHTPDMAATLFVTATLFFASRALERGSGAAYLAGGIASGLAAAAKYNAGLVAVALTVVWLVRRREGATELRALLAAAGASIVAFSLGAPGILFDPGAALAGLRFEMSHYASGHPGATGDAWAFNAQWLIGLTGGMMLFLPGLFLLPRGRALLPAAVFAVLYFTLLASQATRFERNLLPLLPVLAVMAACGAEGVRRRWPSLRTIVAVAAVAALLPAALAGVDAMRRGPDTPDAAARDWLNTELDTGISVLAEAYSPHIDDRDRLVQGAFLAALMPLEHVLQHDAVVLSRRGSGRFLGNDPDGRLQALTAQACASSARGGRDWDVAVFYFRCN